MFISRKHYDDLRLEWAKNHEEARVLAQQNTALQVSLDWMRVRVNQVETERAQLLFLYTGVKVPVPTIAPAPQENPHAMLGAAVHFDDVGDEEASKLGLSWNSDGTVKYSTT